jgi:hypothetical protein
MKKLRILLLVGLFASTSLIAQKPTAIYFSYFKPAAADSANIRAGNYAGVIQQSKKVSVDAATTKKIMNLLRLLQVNGSDDINKCFIPRHAIRIYLGETIVNDILVCFECDGVRFSNEPATKPVKNVAKREAYMKQLKALFVQAGFEAKE